MGKLDEMKQKAEGKIDELRGEGNMQTGETVKGGMQKLKGNLKQMTAPLRSDDDRENEDRA